MGLMEWSQQYSINSDLVDNQHKKLIEIINDMHAAMSEGRGREVLGDVMNRVIEYTKYHFGTEEQLMKTYDYPRYQEHWTEHQKLIKKAQDFNDRLLDGERMMSIEFLEFLRDWLISHIQVSDKKVGEFLSSRGIVAH